jgi:O-methyltransferase
MTDSSSLLPAGPATIPPDDLPEAYLAVLKRALMGGSYRVPSPWEGTFRSWLYSILRSSVGHFGYEVVKPVDVAAQRAGLDFASDADTMVGEARLSNLQACVGDVLRRHIPGDLIETGVWRGGCAIFMRGILKAYGDRTRIVWVADSFQGIPKPDALNYPADKGDKLWTMRSLAIPIETVRANFAKYDLLDDQVQFLEGWFRDTLPTAPMERLAVLRLDGDLFESTKEALDSLYPKVSVGGYVIVDDYGTTGCACREAVDEFRDKWNVKADLQKIDSTGVYWQREGL